eukprot:1871216-Karenia_brevis.AAC.1
MVVGAMLVLLSLRARYSDLAGCSMFSVTPTTLKATVDGTKTSRRLGDRLPVNLVGPSKMTTEGD